MAQDRPGSGLLGWLGRQIGYVTKAVKTDVTRTIVHRQQRVEEARLPEDPSITLRRTIIDEVIVDKKTPQADAPKTEARSQNTGG